MVATMSAGVGDGDSSTLGNPWATASFADEGPMATTGSVGPSSLAAARTVEGEVAMKISYPPAAQRLTSSSSMAATASVT